ncbi:MAG: glycosyltransferase family 4 protein [Acidimicrobiia bacterium]|nr:glycosyltransferase family 4 protein [Acidimicrobiia bacterium]
MLHNRYLTRGGEDVSTDSQVELLRQHGHNVELFEVSNEQVAELGKVRTAARSMWSIESYKQIDTLLDGNSFDVMHVQNFFPLLSPSVYYAAQRRGVPVVQSLRNFRLVCPEGMLHRDGAVCTDCVGKAFAWPSVKHQCYRGSRVGSATIAIMSTGHAVARTWQRKVFRYVTPSAYARQVFLDDGWSPDLIDVIPNFVHPDPGVGPGDGGFALFAGRLDPPKGVGTLIKAWRDGGLNFPLKIVGDGSLRAEVEAAVDAEESIEYLGLVDSSRASELMGEASFVVVPTTGIETFGRVAAEAMAKGTPPVVASHGGLSEIVVDGETGLVFEPGNAGALAAAGKELISDPDRLAVMRSEARARLLGHYEGARVVDQWVSLYRSAMRAG